MGMYTELHFNAELKQDTPKEIINILQTMLGKKEKPEMFPKHAFFQTARWSFMLQCDSYYFDAATYSILKYDKISKSYYLCIRCNFKNYDDEIEKFISWIKPYLAKDEDEFLGFYRYEETEQPTLIFM